MTVQELIVALQAVPTPTNTAVEVAGFEITGLDVSEALSITPSSQSEDGGVVTLTTEETLVEDGG